MKLGRWICIAALLTGGLPAMADTPEAARPAPATLDQAVQIISSVDRGEVYLGEAVNLTLEYRELSVRGLKVQQLYRSGNIELPSMEGFYAGSLATEKDDIVLDGTLYAVTRHRQRIYPAVAGELAIGPWRWQGTVRGHTATGNPSMELDLHTTALKVRVLPLPAPPSTFRGAVGEFTIAQALPVSQLIQGVPVTLVLTVEGLGNPGTLEAPVIPEAPWFSVEDPTEDGAPTPESPSGQFSRQFSYSLMPLTAGSFKIPAVSLTYFSPAARQYKSVRTAPISVSVKESGPAESLVVVGGSTDTLGGPALMEDGRFALAEESVDLKVDQPFPLPWTMLVVLPPFLWLVLVLKDGGWKQAGAWQWPRRRRGHLSAQFQALAEHPEPVEALNGLLSAALHRGLGAGAAGRAIGELRSDLEGRIGPEDVNTIVLALEACRDHRYGKETLRPEKFEQVVRGLPDALEALQGTAVSKGGGS